MFELDLTVKLYVSHDGTGFTETYTLTPDDEGNYNYTYETFKDGTIDFEIRVSDGDKEKVEKIKTIKVGNSTEPKDPTGPDEPKKPGSSTGSCLGTIALLPIVAGAAIILLRKRER